MKETRHVCLSRSIRRACAWSPCFCQECRKSKNRDVFIDATVSRHLQNGPLVHQKTVRSAYCPNHVLNSVLVVTYVTLADRTWQTRSANSRPSHTTKMEREVHCWAWRAFDSAKACIPRRSLTDGRHFAFFCNYSSLLCMINLWLSETHILICSCYAGHCAADSYCTTHRNACRKQRHPYHWFVHHQWSYSLWGKPIALKPAINNHCWQSLMTLLAAVSLCARVYTRSEEQCSIAKVVTLWFSTAHSLETKQWFGLPSLLRCDCSRYL